MNARPIKRTKILATIGPASNTRETLLELAIAGVDVFRLNFSHGTHEDHQKVIDNIRDIKKKFGFNIGILQDLQGPKIRIGMVEDNGVEVKEGEEFIITTAEKIVGNAKKVSCSYESLPNDVKTGDLILIDDGNLQFRVKEIQGSEVVTEVLYGGVLKSRKGINLHDTKLSTPSLTKKDRIDLEFGIKNNVDWVALSFVRSAGDVVELKNILAENNSHAGVISKIEKPEALKYIDAIIDASDAVMIARGDLGVEIYLEEVPVYQRLIMQKCRDKAKPAIVATQMMESMIGNPRPTRAETSDIANAVFDGADALMLSAESAAGKYPVLTVQTMVRIIKMVENSSEEIYNQFQRPEKDDIDFNSKSIVRSATRLAAVTDAKAIIGMTVSGFTAFNLAKHRPKSKIIIFTESRSTMSKLSLIWGVQVFYYDKFVSTDETFEDLEAILVKEGILSKGDVFINTASIPVKARQRTNMVKISQVQ